jgi:catechol 2,3-dioxygenase-like lactoylglutathione lyase family enzyme
MGLCAMVCSTARAQETVPFDHVHLAVPDPAQARAWYLKHLGGVEGETPDRIASAKWPGDHPLPFQILFLAAPAARPSAEGVIYAVGFSFPNLDQKFDELRSAGARLVSGPADVPGLWRRAVVDDPWGTRLELVQDPRFDLPGIHHITLRVPNPDETLKWYAGAFGGERINLAGQFDALRYRDLDLVYLTAVQGDVRPGQGHAIDHISWGPIDLDRVVAALKSRGVAFATDPNPRGNPACAFESKEVRALVCPQPEQLAHRTVFLEAPGGVRVELVQHLEAGGH